MGDNSQRRLSRFQVAAYAMPSLPLALVVFPVYVILPGFYATHTPLGLAAIGSILIFARAFDAVVDPAIGYLSDLTQTRWGRRKPWIVAGTALMCIATPMLYMPSPSTSATSYLFTLLAFYLGLSLIETPHKAWGTELSSDYRLRSLISTSLAIAFALGTLAFALMPFLTASSGVYDSDVLARVAWVLVGALPVCVTLAIFFAPSCRHGETAPVDLMSACKSVLSNRPLHWFLLIFALTGLGQGFFYGLVFLLLTSVMPFGAHFAEFLLIDAIATLVALPVWYFAITRWSKHAAWAVGTIIQIIALALLFLMPGVEADKTLALAVIALRAVGGATIYVAPSAILGDIVDYELLCRRSNRAANFHALVSLLTKGTSTVGGGMGLLLVGWFGFDPKNPSAAAIDSFRIISLALPAVILLGAAALAWHFPLNRRRHSIVARALARRSASVPRS